MQLARTKKGAAGSLGSYGEVLDPQQSGCFASSVASHWSSGGLYLEKKPRRSIYKTGFMTPEDMGRVQLPLKKCINNMNSRTVKMLSLREGNELTNDNNVTGMKSRKQSNKTYKFRDNRPRTHVTQVILSHVYKNQKWLVT